jgi:hypothetical protein
VRLDKAEGNWRPEKTKRAVAKKPAAKKVKKKTRGR